ncbi:hypothetical protein BH09BAC5_BH09BAC5_03720 [soil metagenome]
MYMKKIILLFCSLLSISTFAQTYTQSSVTSTALYATTCSGTYVDNGGGAGSYSNGLNNSYTFYPVGAGNYTTLTFNSFNTENPADYLAIYDGPGGPLLVKKTGTPGVFTVTASSANSTRGLTCRFHSDGNTVFSGWSATISCTASPAAPPAFTPNVQDCEQGGGITICSNTTFNGNSSGNGNVNDLPNFVNGCLTTEHESSWYYFSPSSSGTIGFTISPANGTDDYDFAVFGPFTDVECPLNNAVPPLRCSYAAGGGNTGCGNGAIDVSEGAGGNRWVQDINVIAGEIYVLLIDNFSSSSNPFTLSWNLTNGANLNCTVLPVEFLSFEGEKVDNYHSLNWKTATELNNDHFILERSTEGNTFVEVGRVNGAGTSTQINSYQLNDYHPEEGWNYYRVRQVDFNGHSTISSLVALEYHSTVEFVENVHPVPSNDFVSFDFVSPDGGQIHYQILDCSGRVVSDVTTDVGKGKNALNINMQEFDKGIYFLNVLNENTKYHSVTRLVKY